MLSFINDNLPNKYKQIFPNLKVMKAAIMKQNWFYNTTFFIYCR